MPRSWSLHSFVTLSLGAGPELIADCECGLRNGDWGLGIATGDREKAEGGKQQAQRTADAQKRENPVSRN